MKLLNEFDFILWTSIKEATRTRHSDEFGKVNISRIPKMDRFEIQDIKHAMSPFTITLFVQRRQLEYFSCQKNGQKGKISNVICNFWGKKKKIHTNAHYQTTKN